MSTQEPVNPLDVLNDEGAQHDEGNPSGFEDDVPHEVDQDALDVDATQVPAKPAGNKRKVIAIVMGVVLVAFLAGIGFVVYQKMFAKPKRVPMADVDVYQPADLGASDASSLVAGGEVVDYAASGVAQGMPEAASGTAGAASASDVMTSAGLPQAGMPPTATAALPVAAQVAPVGAQAALPVATQVAAAQPAGRGVDPAEIDKLDSRVTDLEAKFGSLQNMQRRSSTGSAVGGSQHAAANHQASKRKVARVKRAPAPRPTHAAQQLASTSASKAAEAVASTLVSQPALEGAKASKDDLGGLSVRGIYPPAGPDRRAWLMDGEKVINVTAGDKVRGMRVISVEADKVVLDRGVVR